MKKLYVVVVATLLIAVLSVEYYSIGMKINKINENRTTMRIMGSQAFFQLDSDYRVKLQTLMFAIKGIEGRGEDATAIRKVYDQTQVDYQKLQADYAFWMEKYQPMRSIFPPFLKEFPELRNPDILLYKLEEEPNEQD